MPQMPECDELCHRHATSHSAADATYHFRLLHLPSDKKLYVSALMADAYAAASRRDVKVIPENTPGQ
jgi:hypothetical protein